MLIFANFAQKIDFERLQFQRMGMTLTEPYLLKFSSLSVLGEKSFKCPKVTILFFLLL